MRFGRHSTTDTPYKKYTIKKMLKTSEQIKFLEQTYIIHAILILVSNYYYPLIGVKKVIQLLLHRHHLRFIRTKNSSFFFV